MVTKEILSFGSPGDFRAWLRQNHRKSDGIWLRIDKKGSDTLSVRYDQALDQALCFGWIDGQKKTHDAHSWLQRFTPRRANSQWSKKNTEHAERLIKSRLMRAAGQKEVDAAKADGRWQAAYEAFSKATMPDDFLAALARNRKAAAFFATLNKTNLYAISYRLQTAKKVETRERRMKTIVAMLARGEAFH